MAYLIRESNQNDNSIIRDFNKELENHGFNFSLPVPISKNLNDNNFILKNSYILIEDQNLGFHPIHYRPHMPQSVN